jgi:hypothetical protein
VAIAWASKHATRFDAAVRSKSSRNNSHAVGSHATCVLKEFVGVGKNKKRGTKMAMYTTVRINEEEKTCALNFGSSQLGFERYDVPLSELRPIPEGPTSHAT